MVLSAAMESPLRDIAAPRKLRFRLTRRVWQAFFFVMRVAVTDPVPEVMKAIEQR
jgi:hypothetical protein